VVVGNIVLGTKPWAWGMILCVSISLGGCARVVPLEPAGDATHNGCAQVIVRLPDTVDGLPQQQTNAQATGAWGDPSVVLLRCGVEVLGPTTLRCVSISNVDWIIDETNPDYVTAVTYGRDPSTEVVIDKQYAGASIILADLALAVESIPASRKCS
jgi:hypothetical protein